MKFDTFGTLDGGRYPLPCVFCPSCSNLRYLRHLKKKEKEKKTGCIVLNKHNTVFAQSSRFRVNTVLCSFYHIITAFSL